MPSRSSIFFSRQNPTRMPYSCQLQFGRSGNCAGLGAARSPCAPSDATNPTLRALPGATQPSEFLPETEAAGDARSANSPDVRGGAFHFSLTWRRSNRSGCAGVSSCVPGLVSPSTTCDQGRKDNGFVAKKGANPLHPGSIQTTSQKRTGSFY